VKAFLEAWPVIIVAAQVLLVILVAWVVLLVKREVTAGVKPLQDGQADLDRRLKVAEGRLGVVDAMDNRIDLEATRITELTGRVKSVEDDIDELPTRADLARVEGEVKVVLARVDIANEGIKRIEAYAMEGKFA